MYQATNMALIVAVFPKEQRGRALGLMSTFVAAGSIAGPALGGFIVQWLSWESNFWLLAGVAVVVGVLAERSIPRDAERAEGKLDIGGAIYFAACLTTLMIALDLGGRSSFLSLPVLLLTGVSVLSGAALAVRQRYFRRRNGSNGEAKVPDHAGNSLLLLADRRFTSGIAITVITYMAAFAAQLALPAVLRLGGMEPAWIGLIMIGYPLALVFVAPLSGAIADRRGPLGIMTYGLLLMAATLVVLGLTTPEPGTGFILLPIVLLGCSMGMITSPNTSLVMGLAPKANLGMASSLLALSRNIGMMFGTAAGGIVIGSSSGFVGTDMSYRAVFLACSGAVALVCILSAYVYRRADKAKRMTEVGWPRR
jgi:predicted MFS family arabinose efflux permease